MLYYLDNHIYFQSHIIGLAEEVGCPPVTGVPCSPKRDAASSSLRRIYQRSQKRDEDLDYYSSFFISNLTKYQS